MKKILTLLIALVSLSIYSQNINYKEYSYTEFFELIKKSTDSIISLTDLVIKPNYNLDSRFQIPKTSLQKTDTVGIKDSIVIDKSIRLENVYFKSPFRKIYGFKHIVFKGNVEFVNCFNFNIYRSSFNGSLSIRNYNNSKLQKITSVNTRFSEQQIRYSTLNGGIRFSSTKYKSDSEGWYKITIDNSKIYPFKKSYSPFLNSLGIHSSFEGNYQNQFITVTNNQFSGIGLVDFNISNVSTFNLKENLIRKSYVSIRTNNEFTYIENNEFYKTAFIFNNEFLKKNIIINFEQFKDGIIDDFAYRNRFLSINELRPRQSINDSIINDYKYNYRIKNNQFYKVEMKLLGAFYEYYKKDYDMESANKVYVDLKNFETKRLTYLYHKNPSFELFFKWKVNQFLKVFSAYGTKPEKAVVFSMWVILFFAFIYLLFPNSWDSHGRKRIMNRYTFFLKYMDKDAGMHEVYINEQKEELLEFDDFKDFVNSKTKRVPKIFTATALPLYKWAISGTKISSSLLKRVDIMKGTWSELPQSKRIWKSILLIGTFIIVIVYDIFIKILNALMLSINTFTTLGFGEIPIKGLPRYLAIIQGFIGWFMLTIFSVSLISQLLN